MEFYHQDQCRSWQAPRPTTKWLEDWLPRYSGVYKYAAQQELQCSLMNHPQWEKYGWWSSHNPQVKWQRKLMLWRWPPWKGRHREGVVGGDTEVDADPDRHPMVWMHHHQTCYDDEMINFWPLCHPLTDGGETATCCLACRLLLTWEWVLCMHPTSCPPAPTNMEIGRWLPLDRDDHEGSREGPMDRGSCMLPPAHSRGIDWMVLGSWRGRNDPTCQPIDTGIFVHCG